MIDTVTEHAKERAYLKQVQGIVDGKTAYVTIPCSCMIFNFSQADFQYFGAIQNGMIFMVAPTLGFTPKIPGTIEFHGEEYDIKGVRAYRDIHGQTVCYRIAVAGAA